MGDYYQTLGVSRDASEADIKSAYRKLAMKYHPDRNQGDKKAEQKFKDVQKAYQVLADAEKRQAYDQFGEAGVGGAGGNGRGFGGGQGFSGFASDFEDIFGDIFSGSGRRSNRGHDQEVLVELDFIEAAKGCDKKVRIPQIATCDTCGGSGAAPGSKVSTCRHCDGQGRIAGGQGFFSVVQTCPYCRGSGKTIENPCSTCRGEGRVRRTRNLTVNIPAGVDNGMRIRLAGGGDAGAHGGAPGDLYVVVRVKPHPLFRREENNLLLKVVIPVTAAVLGKEIEVPTLTDKVKLKIPPGTQNGALLRLRGKGIHFEYSGEVGDMICEVKVEVPVKLTREQKEMFEALEQSMGDQGSRQQPRQKSWLDEVKEFINGLTN